MSVRFLSTLIAVAAASLAFPVRGLAEECPAKPQALGVSRVIEIGASYPRRVGLFQYQETIPLRDHEVVLTFDDGPLPPHTPKVLDALAAECVKAVFFAVGEMAAAFPELLQREYREGHTIGTHTQHHHYLNRLTPDAAAAEISEGIASVNRVLGVRAAPFFRFPYLDPTPASEAVALKLGLTIWSTDLDSSDWKTLTPEALVLLAISRLERKKKGIILMHDIHERTALALPLLFSELKHRGYRVVHAIPPGGTSTGVELAPKADTLAAIAPQPKDAPPSSALVRGRPAGPRKQPALPMFYGHHAQNGKKPMAAVSAVMRENHRQDR